jgi:hypothetical protein
MHAPLQGESGERSHKLVQLREENDGNAGHMPYPVAALGVFLGILVNTKDFCKTRQNSYDFGKNCGDFSKMNTKVTK